MILSAVDEQHGFGTCQRCDMRIVEMLAQGGDAVGKATIFAAAVALGELGIGIDHPTDGSTRFDMVVQGREHPGTVATHGASDTAYALGIDTGQLRQAVC